jgi:hypothetical protein
MSQFIELSEEEKRKRRSRSTALAWLLVVLVALFYAITVFKLGGGFIKK